MNPFTARLLGSAASTVDRAFVGAMQFAGRKARARAELVSHDERLEILGQIRREYGAPELFRDVEAFFPRPAPVTPNCRFIRKTAWGRECHELSWPSAFEPYEAEVGEPYLAHVQNRTAWARIYGAPPGPPRPAIICVHGYLAGHWALEERTWPIRSMNRWGLDVAVAILPFHGVRARPGDSAPPFPGGDPRITNEAFRQAVTDLRTLIGLLHARGASVVGITGMSLGGYTSALMATVEKELAFAAPLIPLASIADSARDQGQLGTAEQVPLQHAALEAANWVASPLARPSRLPQDRILILAAEADQVTPVAHAERLAAHFGVPALRVHGGHILQTWRATGFRALHALLRRARIV